MAKQWSGRKPISFSALPQTAVPPQLGSPRCGFTRRGGFTLLELLVVIAILSLLAAMLFPVFSQTREKARRASCLSNLKQVGMAVNLYTQDNDETMVNVYRYYGPGNTNLMWWQDMLQPYVENYQLMLCPSQSKPSVYSTARPAGYPNPLRTSYVANNIYNDWAGAAIFPPLRAGSGAGRALSDIEEPTSTIILTEVKSGEMELWDWSQTDLGNGPAHMEKRHQGGSNFVFADGHAKWLRQSERGMWTMRAD